MKDYRPLLMIDESEKDGKAETIMDYFMSWCLRCTSYRYVKEKQPILYQYCKYMLCKLLEKDPYMQDIAIDEVRVWKQEQRTDLWVEVVLYFKDKKEYHALLIENKYYTLTNAGQLEKYRYIFETYYEEQKEFQKEHLHRALVTCIYPGNKNYTILQNDAKNNNYKIFHLYDLVDKSMNYIPAESDIFNQLFLEEWV